MNNAHIILSRIRQRRSGWTDERLVERRKQEEWDTEWLDNDWTPEQLLEFVQALIQERHLPIKQVR